MPFFVAGAASALLTPLVGRLGGRWGLIDVPSDPHLKIHSRPVPISGGVAVVATALGGYLILGDVTSLWLVAGVLFVFGIGLIDDLKNLGISTRVLGILTGGGILAPAVGAHVTSVAGWMIVGMAVLTLAIANAVNILDGQDGLAGGVAAASMLGFAGIFAVHDIGPDQDFALATSGALAGFLMWNRPPARIFLGNGGAYALGAMLAATSAASIATLGWAGLLAAGACLGVPTFEILFTISRRTLEAEPLGLGDRLHSYDLIARSIGRWGSTALFWLGAAVTSAMGVVMASAEIWLATALAAFLILVGSGVAAALWLKFLR